MRRLLIIMAMFVMPMNITGLSECEKKCMRKKETKELVEKCNFIFHQFPRSKPVDLCPVIQPIQYCELYITPNQTTFDELRGQKEFCKSQIMGIVFETMVYICMILWLICFIKFPWP
jgi:hypothetical protein